MTAIARSLAGQSRSARGDRAAISSEVPLELQEYALGEVAREVVWMVPGSSEGRPRKEQRTDELDLEVLPLLQAERHVPLVPDRAAPAVRIGLELRVAQERGRDRLLVVMVEELERARVEDPPADRGGDDVEVRELRARQLAVVMEAIDAEEAVVVAVESRLAKGRVLPVSRVGVARPEGVAERERGPPSERRFQRRPGVDRKPAHVMVPARGEPLVRLVALVHGTGGVRGRPARCPAPAGRSRRGAPPGPCPPTPRAPPAASAGRPGGSRPGRGHSAARPPRRASARAARPPLPPGCPAPRCRA